MPTERRTGEAIVAAATIVIGLLTLAPQLAGDQASRWCLVCGRQVLGDALLNVALFIPLGFGLALLRVRRSRALAIALIATVAIELTQGLLLRGRFASVSDLVTNAAGGLAGHVLGGHWRSLLFPSRRSAMALGGGVLVAWLAIIGFTAWALTPALGPGNYRVSGASRHGSAGDTGFVRGAEVHRVMSGAAPLRDSVSIAGAAERRQLLLFVRLNPATSADEIIARLYREDSPLITIRHQRRLLTLTVHTPARAFYFHEPTIYSGPVDSLPRSSDSLVVVAGGLDGADVRMFFLRDSAVVLESRLSIAPALWLYLLIGAGPSPGFLPPFAALLNAIVLAPVGFWLWSAVSTSPSERRQRSAAVVAAIIISVLVIGYAGIPAATRLAATPLAVWIASVVAVVAGAAAASVAVRHGHRGDQPPYRP